MPAATIFTDGATPIHGVARTRGKTAAFTIPVPQGASIRDIHIRNNTANAVTGGIKVGTVAGGTDVLAAGAVAANALVSFVPLIGAANPAASRTIYVDAVTAWNSANIDIAIEWTDLV
jgi:hypothetical protein